jgi:hypothetical protein
MPFLGKELERRGFIELPGQRGSKTAPWKLSPKQKPAIIAQLAATVSATRPIPDEAFTLTFKQLLKATETTNKDKKGRALEHLAARICLKLDLRNMEIRKLSDYEIDVRAEGHRPIFQKWVMQCKATKTALGPATVLREYGIAKLENIPIIAFVVTSTVSDRARSVADQIMRQSNKVVIFFELRDLEAIAADENALYEILAKQSDHARKVKLSQREAEVIGELAAEEEETTDEQESEVDGKMNVVELPAEERRPRKRRRRKKRRGE